MNKTPSSALFFEKAVKETIFPYMSRVNALLSNGDPVLQKNTDTRFHKLATASDRGELLLSNGESDSLPEACTASVQIFTVAHNWLSAFSDVSSEAFRELRSPYQWCAFEFRVAERNVICIVYDNEDGFPNYRVILDIGERWWIVNSHRSKLVEPFVDSVVRQVQCSLLALDSRLAVRKLIRAPLPLNQKRIAAGKRHVMDHHVVDVSPRQGCDFFAGGGTHASPRLHFRRGHWRHYENHKTWISACLVGDPDLGFLDKTYAL